jgi:excisionase family DNA binding protein
MEGERKVLTVDEVALKLGICSHLVRRQIKKGVIPCIKVGDRYLIPVAAFEKWLAECK